MNDRITVFAAAAILLGIGSLGMVAALSLGAADNVIRSLGVFNAALIVILWVAY